MKRFAIILTVVAVTAMLFSSCGKYDEGPSFSLLTKKARIVGEWKVDEMYINDTLVNFEDLYSELFALTGMNVSNISLVTNLEKDGTGVSSIKYTVLGINGSQDTNLKWEFDDEKENLRIQRQDPETQVWGDWENSEILRLTKSECWIKNTETDDSGTYTIMFKMTKID
jgi:hypothetical protein